MQPDIVTRLETYLASAWPQQSGAGVMAITPISTGWESELYRLDLEDGRRVVLRLYPGEGAWRKAERESQGMRALYELGYPVPKVYWAETNTTPLGKPFMLMAYVPGQVMMDVWLRQDRAGQFALLQTFVRLLVDLHQIDGRTLRRVDDAYSDRYEACDAYAYVDFEMDHLARNVERLPVAGLAPVLAWLRSRREKVPCHKATIVHWDYHPANILLQDDDVPVVIDWTQIRLSDPRFDLAWTLMLIASHVGPELRELFLQGYASQIGDVDQLYFFETFCCLKRLHTVAVMFVYGPQRLGMRPEAVETITALKPAFRIVYEQLVARTGILVPEIEQMLST